MNIIKGILAIVGGIVVGSLVNVGTLLLSFALFGSPEGLDLFDAESVKTHAAGFTNLNFIGTLLAHQLGTFAGAFLAAWIAPARKMIFAVVVGVWFLLGGVYAATIVAAPLWFVAADLILYLPIAAFGGRLGAGKAE